MTVMITGVGAIVARERTPDWFDPAEHLGRRGWKYLSPATRYLLAAANQALGRAHGDPVAAEPPAERLGVVTGTQYAIADVHRRMNHTLRTEGAGGLSPAEVPAFSMNTPGSQLAITLKARAFCVTLTNPATAGLEAVLFAMSALRTGRADRVVATATEQVPDGLGLDGAAAVTLSAAPGGIAELTGGFSRFVARGQDGVLDPVTL
ncbi:beta-ketoacyl synthase N-terminal-like domain-containing protein, partial [Amycolatopsis sp. H20-H5]|uniref:beta-ketoacyl synthase N-terminal-like domain-containing protein n=1 Tax=Amycolatopsis sp. H20-H5 TaxID=3046309 RepID=UPI002DBE0E7F